MHGHALSPNFGSVAVKIYYYNIIYIYTSIEALPVMQSKDYALHMHIENEGYDTIYGHILSLTIQRTELP